MPEVPLEHAHETIEHQAHHATEPWVMGVALTAAILAALAAITALCAEHFAMDAMQERIHESDRWAEYQANSIKEKVILGNKKLGEKLGVPVDGDDEAKLKEYKEKKNEIMEQAQEFKREADRHIREHVPLAVGLTMFQVAIAIGAISVLTKQRTFWFVCLSFGVAGICCLIWGFVA